MNRIKELRELMNIKQADFAKQLNVSQGTLSNWERDVHDPDIESLKKMVEILNTTTDYILGINNEPITADKKEKTHPAETGREKKIKEPTYEVGSLEWFQDGLIARGIIKPGEDLSDEQLQIALANIETIMKIMKK